MAKVCKDGRIWGQNNKTQSLGVFKKRYIKKGFNPKSTGRPFRKGNIPWNKDKVGIYSKEYVNNISNTLKNYKPSKEHEKNRISGIIKFWRDKKRSYIARSKMSLAHGGTGIPYEDTEYGA